jgi:hypothetical protein
MHASHPRALIHMAECLWQVGRGDRAKQFLAEAGRLDHVHGYIRRKAWLHGPCEGPPQSSEGALHRAVCALSTKEAEVCLEWVRRLNPGLLKIFQDNVSTCRKCKTFSACDKKLEKPATWP